MMPALILVSKNILLFFIFNLDSWLDNADPNTVWTPGHRPWKKFILTGGALSAAWWPCPPFTLNNSISLALILCILTWTTPHGLNVTNAIPPFIYSVQPGNLFKLSDPNVFFVHSFVVGSLRYPTPSPCRLILYFYFVSSIF